MHVPAYFGTRPQDVNEVHDVDIDSIARELSDQVEHWNSRGSGFIIEHVKNFVICITIFSPPPWLFLYTHPKTYRGQTLYS